MKEEIGNIFDKKTFCITTNGVVKINGELVMGAGIALEAKKRYPQLPILYGNHVKEYGNTPVIVTINKIVSIISFPTKNNWKDKSNINLIINSCKELVKLVDKYNLTEIYLTRPGCGLGGLDWNYVKPIISKLLDDRFIILTPK
ncbi:MAG: macro domain-containing protein [Candidatus Omnitrophica bacterium]|jgi:O-acetyl-ADP-ribose deacetylase (regulator of RNase III)|nr:macro domain-containing protein [Candidatus Omnitrophota bacterium]